MAHACASIEIDLPPDSVWKLIGGFDSLPEWLPYIPHSELSEGGRVRCLAHHDGRVIVERLMAFDEHARSYSYAILQAPYPVTDYRATLQVLPTLDGASLVYWSGDFTPVGVSDADASSLFQGIYEDGLWALGRGLGAGLRGGLRC